MNHKVNIGIRIAIDEIPNESSGGAFNAVNSVNSQLRKVISDNDSIVLLQDYLPRPFLKKTKNLLEKLVTFIRTTNIYWKFYENKGGPRLGKLEKNLLRDKVDLIIFLNPNNVSSQLVNIPYISTVWDLGHLDYPTLPDLAGNGRSRYQDNFYNQNIRRSFRIFVESNITATNLTLNYGIDSKKIVEINFTPQNNFRYRSNSKTRNKEIAIYPANIWPHKNHRIIVEAVRKLRLEGKKPRKVLFTGVDCGNQDFIIQLIKSYQLENDFEFQGFIPRSKLEEIFSYAYITLFPSVLGPTNLPPLEALALGCPAVIATPSSYNLDKLKGLLVISEDSVCEWAKVLDIDFEVTSPDHNQILEYIKSIEKNNSEKLFEILENFRFLKSLYKL